MSGWLEISQQDLDEFHMSLAKRSIEHHTMTRSRVMHSLTVLIDHQIITRLEHQDTKRITCTSSPIACLLRELNRCARE